MDIKRLKTILAPPRVVFDCVVKDDLIPQWMEELVSISYHEAVDPAADPVGVRFQQKVREGLAVRKYEGEVTAYEQDRHFGIAFGDRRFRFHLDYHIVATDRGCQLTYHLRTVEESFLMRLAAGAVKTMAVNMVDKNLRKLKRFAERRAQPSPNNFA